MKDTNQILPDKSTTSVKDQQTITDTELPSENIKVDGESIPIPVTVVGGSRPTTEQSERNRSTTSSAVGRSRVRDESQRNPLEASNDGGSGNVDGNVDSSNSRSGTAPDKTTTTSVLKRHNDGVGGGGVGGGLIGEIEKEEESGDDNDVGGDNDGVNISGEENEEVGFLSTGIFLHPTSVKQVSKYKYTTQRAA